MAEVETIVDDRKVTYEGLFSVSEVYKLIDNHFAKLGYDRAELKNTEIVRPEGKYIEIVLEPNKTVSDYAKYVINIRLIFSEIKDSEVRLDGKKKKMNLGKAQIIWNGYLIMDKDNRWEEKPLYYLVRATMNKYILRGMVGKYKSEIKSNVESCVSNTASFLNLSHHRF